MFSLTATRKRHLLLLLLLGSVLFFAGLGSLPLLEPDEGRNAEVAREVLESGDWITPHFVTFPYLDKPAVFFWLVATSFRIWGVSEWAARFPSALMALATMVLTWGLAICMFGDAAGLRAACILATSPLVIVLARLVSFDLTLALFVTLAMFSFWVGESQEKRSRWWDGLLFAAMGAATVTKGPVGFLLPLLSIVTFQAMRGKLGELRRLDWLVGVGLFLATTLPWFIAVSVRNPEFPRYAFWQESLLRFATGSARRTGSFFYYTPVFLAGFFPWSFFLLFASWRKFGRWRELRQEAQKPVAFLLAWVVAVFVFFSISRSKLPGYFLPGIIPLSILMAKVWKDADSPEAARPPGWLTAGFAVLIGLGLLLTLAPGLSYFAGVQVRLEKRLHPAVLATIKPSLQYSGLILAALAFMGRNLAMRAKSPALSVATFALAALTFPLLVARWMAAIRSYAVTTSSRQLADTIRASPQRDFPLYGYYYFRTSLPFYLQRPVGLVTTDASELTSNYISSHLFGLRHRDRVVTSSFPGGHRAPSEPRALLLFDPKDLAVLSQHGPILVIVRNSHVSSLGHAVGRIEQLWSVWDYSVWKIPAGVRPAGLREHVTSDK